MDTESDRLVINGEVITEGTSLFLTQTREVAWITRIEDYFVHIETITDSLEIREDRFVKQIFHEDIVVESQPTIQRAIR